MNSRIRPSLIPQCSACIRSYVEAGWRPLHQQQMRGAKSSRMPDTIPVQLLKDLDKFGCKGTFVPVPAGTMRNKWFPYNVARYATFEEKRAIKRGEIDVMRDYEFEIMADVSGHGAARQRFQGQDGSMATLSRRYGELASSGIEIKTVEPNRAVALLEILLPDLLPFERKPVPKAASPNESKSKLPASVQAMLKASMPKTPTAIYGSVSTQDVAQYIRDEVAYNDEAGQIQLNETNLKFVDPIEGDDASKIKHLGTYEVEISFKGADTTIRKKVVVKRPNEDPAEAMVDPSIAETAPGDKVIDYR